VSIRRGLILSTWPAGAWPDLLPIAGGGRLSGGLSGKSCGLSGSGLAGGLVRAAPVSGGLSVRAIG
jgi:hypothetical protein